MPLSTIFQVYHVWGIDRSSVYPDLINKDFLYWNLRFGLYSIPFIQVWFRQISLHFDVPYNPTPQQCPYGNEK